MNQLLLTIKSKLVALKYLAMNSTTEPSGCILNVMIRDLDATWDVIEEYERKQIICNNMKETGKCRFGENCRYNHNVTITTAKKKPMAGKGNFNFDANRRFNSTKTTTPIQKVPVQEVEISGKNETISIKNEKIEAGNFKEIDTRKEIIVEQKANNNNDNDIEINVVSNINFESDLKTENNRKKNKSKSKKKQKKKRKRKRKKRIHFSSESETETEIEIKTETDTFSKNKSKRKRKKLKAKYNELSKTETDTDTLLKETEKILKDESALKMIEKVEKRTRNQKLEKIFNDCKHGYIIGKDDNNLKPKLEHFEYDKKYDKYCYIHRVLGPIDMEKLEKPDMEIFMKDEEYCYSYFVVFCDESQKIIGIIANNEVDLF